jgi:hypothetical protein
MPVSPEDAADTLKPSGPRAGRLRFTWWRIALALAIAVPADIVLAPLELVPPVGIPIDVAIAVLLWLILGRPTVLLVALILEAIPGLGILPFWSLVVVAISVWGRVPGRGVGDPIGALVDRGFARTGDVDRRGGGA